MEGKQQSRREALAKRVYGMCWPQEAGWPTWCGAHEVAQRRAESVADFILAEQERREGPLVEALKWCHPYTEKAGEAIRAHRALDAPPQRTVEDVLREWNDRAGSLEARAALAVRLLDELAALRRGKE